MKWFLKRRQRPFSAGEEDSSLAAATAKGPVFKVACPHCDSMQEVPEHGFSAFCKKCRGVISIEKAIQPRELAAKPRQDLKVAACIKCGAEQPLPRHALSTFCKKCGKRMNLQNYKIAGKFHGTLETMGEIHVTPSGEVRSEIFCGSAVVEGKINGSLKALSRVELRQTAEMNGAVEAASLVVEDGAAFRGAGKIAIQ